MDLIDRRTEEPPHDAPILIAETTMGWAVAEWQTVVSFTGATTEGWCERFDGQPVDFRYWARLQALPEEGSGE